MLFEPLLGTSLSGSVGGIVASHNAGGAYFRARVVPTNPNTVFQIAVRSQVASLTVQWQTALTPLQRDAWNVYARNVTVTNRIGNQVNISGIAHFVRSNTSRVQIGLATRNEAPTIFNLGSYTAPTLSNATAAIQTVDVNFFVGPTTDPWATQVGSFLMVYIARPQNSGIEYFTGPYRFAGSVQGDPVPPVTPLTVGSPFPFVVGQKIFGFFRVIFQDGRLTTETRAFTIAVA